MVENRRGSHTVTRLTVHIAYQTGKTVYQIKHGMLSDYLIEQLKHPFVQMMLA